MICYSVITDDEEIFDFEGRCNYVETTDKNYLMCYSQDDKGNRSILGMFAHYAVRRIIAYEKKGR